MKNTLKVLAVLPFLSLGIGAPAAAPEPVKEEVLVNITCLISLAPDVKGVVAMHASGTPYLVIEHLIRTDSTYRGSARWVLVQVLDALTDGRLKPEDAYTFLWGLCAIPLDKHGDVEEKDKVRHEADGMYWPIKGDKGA